MVFSLLYAVSVFSITTYAVALVAQLDRAWDFESKRAVV